MSEPSKSNPSESEDETTASDSDLPASVVDEAERLTRLARQAVDDAEAAAYRERRDRLLDDHGFTSRVREDDGGDVLVCYPDEWVEDGTVVVDRIEDVDRGAERPLEGPGDGMAWAEVDAENRATVAAMEGSVEPVHVENARSLADFAGNHYAKPIAALTTDELREFLTEYFPRNAFPTDEQRDAIEESIRLTYDRLDRPVPDDLF